MIPDKIEWIKILEERHGKELQNKIQDERLKQQKKMEKQSKIVWLIKIEYHV